MARPTIAALGALGAVVALGTAALAQSAYDGLVPVAGDDHQHAGSLISNYVAWGKQNGTSPSCPHDFGRPTRIFELQREAGYDWSVIAQHDRATHGGLTGDPDGSGPEPDESLGAYQLWWANPAATPLRLADGTPFVTPNPAGLPDYVTGGTVKPGWNEARSFASAAELANRPAEDFVAFAGREYTTDDPRALSDQPGEGGHKVVLLPGPSDRICGPLDGHQGARHDCDETELYRWAHARGAILIQAHPGSWAEGLSPWHPETARAGLSDRFVQGVEIGRPRGLSWEHGFQNALLRGHRLFPSFGSDGHYVEFEALGLVGCESSTPPDPANGATLCWVPSGGMTRATILDAMRERRCYYARSHAPSLAFEMRDGASDAWRPMGALLAAPDGQAEVRVRALNDLDNQAALGRRFDRLELVHVGLGGVTLLHACNDCCTRDPLLGDRCELAASLGVSRGAIYPRICTGSAGCGTNGAQTVTVGAPVFVDWTPLDPACDHDGDGVDCLDDDCWVTANPGQADADGDGVGDACDLCPTAPDPDQSDADADGTGDACEPDDADGDGWPSSVDSCPTLYDAVQRDDDGDGVGNVCDNCIAAWNPALDTQSLPPSRSATGGQLDDDGDGYGNRCDADFVAPSPAMDAADRAELDATLPVTGPYPSVVARTCGTSGALACDAFDVSVDVTAARLDGLDRSVALQIQAAANAGPKCAVCGVNFRALPCTGDACVACNDGRDNDGDGAIDYPQDPTCASARGSIEGAATFCGLGPLLVAALVGGVALELVRRRT